MNWISGFWLLAGAMCGFGAAFLLLRGGRSQPSAAAATGRSRWTVLAGLGGLAVVVGLYLWLGHPELVGNAPPQAASPAAMPHAGATPPSAADASSGGGGGSMDAAVAGLETRLAEGKGSDADWNLLAQSYEFLGRSADAALARKKQLPATRTQVATPGAATARAPDAATLKLINDANVARRARNYAAARDIYVKLAARGSMTADTWADYADVTASLKGGSLSGEAEKYITEALKVDPHHPKALWLQGSMQHEAGRYAEALATWERLAAVLDPNSSDAKLIAANIAEDRRLSGLGTAGAKPAAVAAGVAKGAGVVLSGEITVADALKARAAAGQPLFIFAKAVGQPGPPVAVLRTTTGQWPLRFKLDDSLAMMPTRTLSTAGKVTVEARISRSGQAIAAAGDLQGATGVIDPKAAGALRIVIDRVVN